MPVSPIFTSLFKSLGANPTSINFNELYTALQTHLVDGQENGLVTIEAGKLYEVQKYVSETNHIWDPFWLLGNRRALTALPENLRQIVRREFDRAAIEQRADIAKLNTTLKEQLITKGLIFEAADKAALPHGAVDQGRLLQGMARQVRRRDLDRARGRGRSAVMSAARRHAARR